MREVLTWPPSQSVLCTRHCSSPFEKTRTPGCDTQARYYSLQSPLRPLTSLLAGCAFPVVCDQLGRTNTPEMKGSAKSLVHRSRSGSLTDDSANLSSNDGDGALTPPPQSPTSDKETQEEDPDQLAMLFTVQEERCPPGAGQDRKVARPSKGSVLRADLARASFIYQRIDFGVLAKCVPPFVRSHLHRNGRYLPETFILRVNYLRRRRQLGEDSTVKRPVKDTSTGRNCNESGLSPSPRLPAPKS